MNRHSLAAVIIAFFLSHQLFALASITEQIPSLSIEEVIANSLILDGKEITVEGVVKKLRFTHSRSGKRYTIFRLHDDNNMYLSVYSKGKLHIKKGDRLRITGKFKRKRRYFIFKFRNILKAKSVEDLSNGESLK